MTNEQMVTIRVLYTYQRYGETITDEEDDLASAVSRAVFDIELNEAYPVKIAAVDDSFSYERGEPFDWNGSLDKLLNAKLAEMRRSSSPSTTTPTPTE